MIIYSGFWAGFISGFFVAFVVIMILATISNYKQQKAKEQMGKFFNALHDAAKEAKERSEQNGSNN